ncbi:3-hydroxyacyl-CoA dehydrogenase family protein [Natrarchaeobius sp. A-rgal3]|uniref:3-hydroxyacyl-CoA dehydrogenase family protein n=1 Tax=Natrarchaeobius versutus TaxID=1679078 RepID=UPI00350F5FD7
MNVAVLGAGTMGRGIAQVAGMAGHDVTLRDVDDRRVRDGIDAIEVTLSEGIDRGKVDAETASETLERIEGTIDLESAVEDVDLVVEAVPEDLELKADVLSSTEDATPRDAVVASNTSSLPVTELVAALDRPERGIGLHFFNPVHIMSLVEVVVAEQTAAEVVDVAHEFVESIDKVAIEVADSPGFSSSRLGVGLGVEAMRMVEEGVASPRDVDRSMTLGYNHPVGPIELGDVVGLDVRLDILEHLRTELGERFRPPQILKRKVRAGNLGKKTGEGFYRWENGEIVGTVDGPGDRGRTNGTNRADSGGQP